MTDIFQGNEINDVISENYQVFVVPVKFHVFTSFNLLKFFVLFEELFLWDEIKKVFIIIRRFVNLQNI